MIAQIRIGQKKSQFGGVIPGKEDQPQQTFGFGLGCLVVGLLVAKVRVRAVFLCEVTDQRKGLLRRTRSQKSGGLVYPPPSTPRRRPPLQNVK